MTLRINERIYRPCSRCNKMFLPTTRRTKICNKCIMISRKKAMEKRIITRRLNMLERKAFFAEIENVTKK